MKTINITVTLTDTEYDFLKLGKCDIPSPQRLKMMLLREAARNLRNMSESVLQLAQGKPELRGEFHHVNTKAELRELNRERRGIKVKPSDRGILDMRTLKLEAKVKRQGFESLEDIEEKHDISRARINLRMRERRVGLVLTKPSKSKSVPSAARPLPTDGSAQRPDDGEIN